MSVLKRWNSTAFRWEWVISSTGNKDLIANEYMIKPYNVGDYVIYNEKLFRCKTAIDDGEAWNVSHWERSTVTDEISDIRWTATTDKTLTTENRAADAKATGDLIEKTVTTVLLGSSIGLIEKNIGYEWEQGSIVGFTGEDGSSDYAIHTTTNDYTYLDEVSRITCDSEHKFYITVGEPGSNYGGVINTKTGKIEKEHPQDEHYTQDLFLGGITDSRGRRHAIYKITLKRVDDEAISPTDVDFEVHTYGTTDETLTQVNIPADAAAVGIYTNAIHVTTICDAEITQGEIATGNGNEVPSTNSNYNKRCKTKFICVPVFGLNIEASEGYKFRPLHYANSTGGYVGVLTDDWVTSYNTALTSGQYIRLIIAKTDDSQTITPEDSTSNITITANSITDETLTQSSKAADAKAVGDSFSAINSIFNTINSNFENTLIYRRTLTSNDNLDNILPTGIYFCQQSSKPVNTPSSYAGVLLVYGLSGHFCQIYINKQNNIFIRYKDNNTWSDWTYSAKQSELDNLSATINDLINGLLSIIGYTEYTVDDGTTYNGYIDNDGEGITKWFPKPTTSSTNMIQYAVEANWSHIYIKGHLSKESRITFLSAPVTTNGSDPGSEGIEVVLASEETGRREIKSNADVLLKIPEDCTHIVIQKYYKNNSYFPQIFGVIDTNLKDQFNLLDEKIDNVEDKIGINVKNLENISATNRTITNEGTVRANNNYKSKEISVEEGQKGIFIEANENYPTLVAFLVSGISSLAQGDLVPFATGEITVHSIPAGTSEYFIIPEDCEVINIRETSNGQIYAPKQVISITNDGIGATLFELIQKNKEKITGIEAEKKDLLSVIGYEEYLSDQGIFRNGYIDANNIWKAPPEDNQSTSMREYATEGKWKYIYVKGTETSNRIGYITFLTASLGEENYQYESNLESILAEGETSRHAINPDDEVILKVPDDCTYVLVQKYYSNTTRFPNLLGVFSIGMLDNKMSGKEVEYTPEDGTLKKYFIDSDNTWSTASGHYYHSIIDITNEKVFKVIASQDDAAIIAFLTNATPNSEIAPYFCESTPERLVIEAGRTEYFFVPSDAKYFYYYRGQDSSSYKNTPASIVSYTFNLNYDTLKAIAYSSQHFDFDTDKYTRDIPQNQGMRNEYKKIMQLNNVTYTLPATIWSRIDKNAISGRTLQGVIYSGGSDKAHYVGWNVSLRSYMTAIHNPYSGIYTENVLATNPPFSTKKGGLNTENGKAVTSQTTRCRTNIAIKMLWGEADISIDNGLKFMVLQYLNADYPSSTNDSYVGMLTDDWVTSYHVSIPTGQYIRIMIAKTDDTQSFTDEEAEECAEQITITRKNSSVYDNVVYYGSNATTPIGSVCAPYAVLVAGMPIKWENHAFPYLERMGIIESIPDQSYTGVELGDFLCYKGHAAVISDIYRDSRGEPKRIFISESKALVSCTREYSPSSFMSRMAMHSHYDNELQQIVPGNVIYRFPGLCKNLDYTPSEFVAVEDEPEPEPYEYNDDICPILGDYSVYNEGELIAMCYTKGNYTTMKINKDETDILTINLPASDDVHNIDLRSYNLTAGSYSARLSGGPGEDSTPCYFDILDLPISVSESENNITVTFDKDKDPRYIQVCIRTGAARCVVPLTKEDIAAGTKTFNISEVIAAQRSGVTNKQNNYVIVLYGVTDPGGYKLVRATDFVKLDWTDKNADGSDETGDEDEDPD